MSLRSLGDPRVVASTKGVVGQEEDHFLQRSREAWEEEGAWTLRVHVLCGRGDWARVARENDGWCAPWVGPEASEEVKRALAGVAEDEKNKSGPSTPHTSAMRAASGVRTHDYPSDFLHKWCEAAEVGAVADKLPPHAMPVSAAQIKAALEYLEPLEAARRQVTAVPAWDGRRIVGYALLHALPPAHLLLESKEAPPPMPLPAAVDPLECRARALRAALRAAGASPHALAAAFEGTRRERPASEGTKEPGKASWSTATEKRARAAASRCGTPAELALFEAGLRAPLEALVSTLYLASVKDQNPLHAIELIASAACHGKRTLLPWSGEWADPRHVGAGGDEDPCEKLATAMGLDILEVAGAVHRGREFVEPVLELGLSSGQNGLFRALATFGAEVVAQCSVDDAPDLKALGGRAAVKKLSKLLTRDPPRRLGRTLRATIARSQRARSSSDPPPPPNNRRQKNGDLAALAETLLARALAGRDKYAPKALMKAAATAAQVLAARGVPLPPEPLLAGYAARLATAAAQRDVEGVQRALAEKRDIVPVVLVLAFEESVYVVLEARRQCLEDLVSRSAQRVVLDGEAWTGGGFGQVEVMLQLPQPLRLACDRALLQQALADAAPYLTLALLPGADDLVAVPIAGLYVRTAAASGLAGGPFNTNEPPPGGGGGGGGDTTTTPFVGALLDRAEEDEDEDEDEEEEEDDDDDDDDQMEDRAGGEEEDDDDEGGLDDEEDDEEEEPSSKDDDAATTTWCDDDDDDDDDRDDDNLDLPRDDQARGQEEPSSRAAADVKAAYVAATQRVGDRRQADPPAHQPPSGPPASPASLLLASYLGFRDGLRHNGPPLDAEKPAPLRPSTHLLKALSKSPQPQVKLAGRVVSVQSIRDAIDDSRTLPNARLALVRCPVLKDHGYVLPHVHTLMALQRKPNFPPDEPLRLLKKRKPTDSLDRRLENSP